MRVSIIILVLSVLLSACVVKTQESLPSCSVTTCTTSSDCPQSKSFHTIPVCSKGVCTTASIIYVDIGGACNVSSTTSRCMDGLICSPSGSAGTPVCQTTCSYGCTCQDDDDCDGGLCLNGSCDAMRSIGDPCTTNEHCGSVCVNSKCIAGPIAAKCNADHSCQSGYCDENSGTCQADTRRKCGPANPFDGKCEGADSVCYDGTCYTRNGGVGSTCNSSVPFPLCKVTLGCVSGACQNIPEGTPCTSSRPDCTAFQECVCGSSSSSSKYGCYSTSSVECSVAYQGWDDCLNACTESYSKTIPNTCAYKCNSKKAAYDRCISCSLNRRLLNYKGTYPNYEPASCCSATKACGTVSVEEACPTNSTSTTSASTILSYYAENNKDQSNNANSKFDTISSYLFLASILVCSSIFLS